MIEDFYYQSQPRLLPKEDDERWGYIAFWNEWYRLRYQFNQKTYPIELDAVADKKRRQYLWQKLNKTMNDAYPYWYPLYNVQSDIPVISFDRNLFKQEELWEYIHQYFEIHQIEFVFEIQELTNTRLIDCFTSTYFMDKDEDSYDLLLMSECFWFDVSHLWLIYVSHEATITFAGYHLVSYIKKNQKLLNHQIR